MQGKKIPILVLAVGLFGIVLGGLLVAANAFLFSSSPTPEQPIAFSHVTHAHNEEIACQYCHIYAKRSSVAGVPSVQKCTGCHEMIGLDDPEVQKLLSFWDKREPIPWKKVYDLPDFVYFSHRMHLSADIACKQCHGDVSQMERVKQVSSLSMGWCLKCHKKMKGPIDCVACHK